MVIVGGGAGGLPLATRLGERFGRRGRADITLVDQNATHLWKPLLHEVAAGRMDADARSLHSEFLAERVAIYDFALKSHVETLRRVGLALAGGARGGR